MLYNNRDLIPITNMEMLKNYWQLSYTNKGKLIESIGLQFLKFNNMSSKEITTKLLQKTQGDTVATMVIPDLINKQITIEFKAGGSSKGYNDLCIDIEYLTKEGTPYLNNGTNIGWLFTTTSNHIITVTPNTKKLYYINWYNGLHMELIRAYSLYVDGIEELPNWVTLDLITIDKLKNTKVLRINLNKLVELKPELILEYNLIDLQEYFNILEKELA